jgi:hypothetical protein
VTASFQIIGYLAFVIVQSQFFPFIRKKKKKKNALG